MSTFCTAFAYAVEPSERTLAATAAFTGRATFALMSDIAARSGSSSPASSFSSSRLSGRYSFRVSDIEMLLALRSLRARGLVDVGRLLGVRVRDRAVRE